MRELRKLFEVSLMDNRRNLKYSSISAIEYERISNTLEKITNAKRMHPQEKHDNLRMLMRETEKIMMNCNENNEHMHFRNLMRRIEQAYERDI